MTKFGERLRKLRTARRWSQERLGFDLGVGKATISKWENGLAEPSFRQLLSIKRVFADQGISLDYLIDDDSACAHLPVSGGKGLVATVSEDEALLLARYRRLDAQQRRSLLGLLGS